VLEFLGHDVLRLNHVGDWGTQFGMLILFLKERAAAESVQRPDRAEVSTDGKLDVSAVQIGDLVELYKAAKRRFDEDATFRERAREEVVRLQGGEPDSLRVWAAICEKSRQAFQDLYDALGVRLVERGESFYNPMLPGLVEKLRSDGVAVESEGALCVFLDGFKNAEGTPLPVVHILMSRVQSCTTVVLISLIPVCLPVSDCAEVGRRVPVRNHRSGGHLTSRDDGAGGQDNLCDGCRSSPTLRDGFQGCSQSGPPPATPR
jgi:hypothetical protein